MTDDVKYWPKLDIENVGQGPFENDAEVFLASIAISLKRVADAMCQRDRYGQTGSAALSSAVRDGIMDAR